MTTAKINQLRLIFDSADHPLCLYVATEEAERLRDALHHHDTTKGRPLHWLSTLESCDVLISLDKLKFCQFGWEPSAHVGHKFAANTDEGDTVLIGFAGLQQPIQSDCDSPDELYQLFSLAETVAPEEYLSYTDTDGEEVFINLNQVNYLQAPSWLVQDGMAADLAELEAAEEDA